MSKLATAWSWLKKRWAWLTGLILLFVCGYVSGCYINKTEPCNRLHVESVSVGKPEVQPPTIIIDTLSVYLPYEDHGAGKALAQKQADGKKLFNTRVKTERGEFDEEQELSVNGDTLTTKRISYVAPLEVKYIIKTILQTIASPSLITVVRTEIEPDTDDWQWGTFGAAVMGIVWVALKFLGL
jgi:hypothetical protein